MRPPSPNECFDFFCAYFGDRVVGTRRESSHFVIEVSDLPDNLSVPSKLSPLPDRIFAQLLRSAGIARAEFEQLAGDPKKLKAYCKKRTGAA